jgi:hypothetical protein
MLNGIAGTSPSSLWTGGEIGDPGALVEQWNPTADAWVQSENSSGNIIASMSARSPTEVWAVGPPGPSGPPFVVRWNGSVWQGVPYPHSEGIVADVDAKAEDGSTWFVGDGTAGTASVDRYQGARFKDMRVHRVGRSMGLGGVATVPHSGNVWVVGHYYAREGGDNKKNLAERYTCT